MKAKFQICKNLHTIRFVLVRGYKMQADTEFTMGGTMAHHGQKVKNDIFSFGCFPLKIYFL